MKRIIFLVAFFVFLTLVGCTAPAGQIGQPLNIQEAWARPGLSGGNSAVYFIIDNSSGTEDKLLGASCAAAKMVQVHMTTTDAEGNSKMMHQESVDIPDGEKVDFKPGGLHVMLMNLNQDLEPGQKLAVTLQFEKAGDIQVEAQVREP